MYCFAVEKTPQIANHLRQTPTYVNAVYSRNPTAEVVHRTPHRIYRYLCDISMNVLSVDYYTFNTVKLDYSVALHIAFGHLNRRAEKKSKTCIYICIDSDVHLVYN